MQFDVFISYPHQDKATADAACAALESNGVRCWIAPRDVAPGADWAASIVTAINQCRVVVLIFSASANQSKQIHREVQQAFDKEKPVLPFRIENVRPEESLAYYMGPVHWLDALTPPLEPHLQQLTASVKGLVRGTETTPRDTTVSFRPENAEGLAVLSEARTETVASQPMFGRGFTHIPSVKGGPSSSKKALKLKAGRARRLIIFMIAAALSVAGLAAANQAGLPYITYGYWAYRPSRAILNKHDTDVSALAFSPTGNRFASGGADFRVRLWNADNLEENFNYESQARIDLLAFSPNGKWLAVHTGHFSQSGTSIQLLNLESKTAARLLSGPVWKSSGLSLAFSPDSSTIVTSSGELWDIATGTATGLADGCRGPLAISPDGRWIAAAPIGGFGQSQIVVCDVSTRQFVRSFGQPAGRGTPYEYVGFLNPDYVLTISDETVDAWSVRDGSRIFRSRTGNGMLQAFTCNAGCGLIGWANVQFGNVEIRKVQSDIMREPSHGEILWSRAPSPTSIISLAISPDAKHVVAGSFRRIEVWDLP